jgi:hypothetical protein
LDGIERDITAASVIILAVAAYVAAGVCFAVAFVSVGIARLDPAARTTSIVVRMALLPGAAAFWPVLLTKWIKTARPA